MYNINPLKLIDKLLKFNEKTPKDECNNWNEKKNKYFNLIHDSYKI